MEIKPLDRALDRNPPLVLASTSRYRRDLLDRLRVRFTVASPDADETPHPGESCEALALRLAEAKARSLHRRYPAALIIGSDQVCDLGGKPLGKPGRSASPRPVKAPGERENRAPAHPATTTPPDGSI